MNPRLTRALVLSALLSSGAPAALAQARTGPDAVPPLESSS